MFSHLELHQYNKEPIEHHPSAFNKEKGEASEIETALLDVNTLQNVRKNIDNEPSVAQLD